MPAHCKCERPEVNENFENFELSTALFRYVAVAVHKETGSVENLTVMGRWRKHNPERSKVTALDFRQSVARGAESALPSGKGGMPVELAGVPDRSHGNGS